MEVFGGGGAITERLEVALSKFWLVCIVERQAERPHALIKRRKGFHKAGPATVSMTLRLPEWRQLVEDDEAALHALGTHLNSLRTPRQVVRALGLQDHPAILETERLKQKHVVQAVYHCDPATKYRDATDVAKEQESPPEEHAKASGPSQCLWG